MAGLVIRTFNGLAYRPQRAPNIKSGFPKMFPLGAVGAGRRLKEPTEQNGIERCAVHGSQTRNRSMCMTRKSIWTRYGFAWVTLALFLITLTGHWIFGWYSYANEQLALQQPAEIGDYTVQMMRDTLENWQSEFLQLLWQVAGLAILLHVGSPQSKEGDDRIEAKIDAILLAVEPKKGDSLLKDIDDEYEGRHTDARFVRMLERRHS
ncbi:DUF6766 family protein [Bradyrhizobium retamae]|nr:DUF6766 family protein [Bradyrhizobium retamae]